MIYPFRCECGHYEEIVCHNTQYSPEQTCPMCNKYMDRIYTAPQLMDISANEYFDEGLGKVVGSSKQVERELKELGKMHDTEYTRDNLKPKKKRKGIRMSDSEMREIHRMLEE